MTLMQELLEMATSKNPALKLSAAQIKELKAWYKSEVSKRSGDRLLQWFDQSAAADVEDKAFELLGINRDYFQKNYSDAQQNKFTDFLDELDLE